MPNTELTAKERLLKGLPKKYHERVGDFTAESGLRWGCKYILLLEGDWRWSTEYDGFPCKSLKEAREIIKEAEEICKKD